MGVETKVERPPLGLIPRWVKDEQRYCKYIPYIEKLIE